MTTHPNPHNLRYSIIAAHPRSPSFRITRRPVIHYVPASTPTSAEISATLCGRDSWVIARNILASEHLCTTCLSAANRLQPELGLTIVSHFDH